MASVEKSLDRDAAKKSHPADHGPDSSSGSEAFENLLAQLRLDEKNKEVQCDEHSDSSFVVPAHSSSNESDSDDVLTFYRRMENMHLKEEYK